MVIIALNFERGYYINLVVGNLLGKKGAGDFEGTLAPWAKRDIVGEFRYASVTDFPLSSTRNESGAHSLSTRRGVSRLSSVNWKVP
jgi:hypothetical protein